MKIRLRNDDFLISGQLMRHPLIDLFHLSNLLQMLNSHRTVAVGFLDTFSRGSNRVSFSDALSCPCQLLTAAPSLLFTVLVSFAKLLQRTLARRPWVTCAVDVVSCLHCFYNPSWTQIRKSLKFALCLTSFPPSKINIKCTANNKSLAKR